MAEDRDPTKREHHVFTNITVPLMAATMVALVDTLVLFLILGMVPQETLVLIMFLEGGIGLITGVGISLSSTPTVAAVGERLFGTSPWSRDAERHAERVGWRWMLASAMLIILAFAVSAV